MVEGIGQQQGNSRKGSNNPANSLWLSEGEARMALVHIGIFLFVFLVIVGAPLAALGLLVWWVFRKLMAS